MRNLAAIAVLALSMSACSELRELAARRDARRLQSVSDAGRRSTGLTPRGAELRASDGRLKKVRRNPAGVGARSGSGRASPLGPRRERAASPARGKEDPLSEALVDLAFGWYDKWKIRERRKEIKRHNKRLLYAAPRLRFRSGWIGFRGICEGEGRDEGVAAGFRGKEGFMLGSRLKRTEFKLDGRDSRGSWYRWRRGRSEGLILVEFLPKGVGFDAEWFSRDGASLAKCRGYRRD